MMKAKEFKRFIRAVKYCQEHLEVYKGGVYVLAKDVPKVLEQYAQQEKREAAVEFALSFDVDLLHELSPDDIWKKYDLWIN